MKIEWRKTTNGVSDSLNKVPRGARIEAIDGVSCLGLCESCCKPILEGQDHASDDEGTMVCGPCMADLRAECGHPSEGD